jgi:hypothetical protein
MRMNKTILILIVVMLNQFDIFGQTIEGVYQGWWARTNWTYEFKDNNEFIFNSTGHGGFDTVKGSYIIKGDTIVLNSPKSDSTLAFENEQLIIDGDSCIIDLSLRYDYCKKGQVTIDDGDSRFFIHNSRTRNVKHPQISSDKSKTRNDLNRVLILSLSHKSVSQYYHFDKLISREFIIKSYYEVNESFPLSLSIHGKKAKVQSDVRNDFYIEIEDINQNENTIDLEFEIVGEGVRVWFTFELKKGKWTLSHESINET